MIRLRALRLALAAAAMACGSFRVGPVRASLIGSWTFDGCGPSDSSGNGADLVAHSDPACAGGSFGDARAFDGVTE